MVPWYSYMNSCNISLTKIVMSFGLHKMCRITWSGERPSGSQSELLFSGAVTNVCQWNVHGRIGMRNAKQDERNDNKLLYPAGRRMSTLHAGCNERATTGARYCVMHTEWRTICMRWWGPVLTPLWCSHVTIRTKLFALLLVREMKVH